MGMKLTVMRCPACGQMMSETVGPNYTAFPAPGGTAIVLTCLNVQCAHVIGTYLLPK